MRHFFHIVSSHSILPDTEILAQFVLLEEIYFLQSIIALLVDKPLIFGHKLSLFVMVESNSLTTDRHVLLWFPLSVSHDLVIIGVTHSIQIEEVF